MRFFGLATLLFLLWFHTACRRDGPPAVSSSKPENSVATFLQNAERQSETDDQRREIQRALRDMLNKSPDELRQTRYADYIGTPNAWTITELLQHYFVPNPPAALPDEKRFFEDINAPAARAAIQHQLDEVSRALK